MKHTLFTITIPSFFEAADGSQYWNIYKSTVKVDGKTGLVWFSELRVHNRELDVYEAYKACKRAAVVRNFRIIRNSTEERLCDFLWMMKQPMYFENLPIPPHVLQELAKAEFGIIAMAGH